MARVTVTEVTAGDDVTETDPNSTISSWNLQTASIEGDNIRDGGIHQRNIAAETATVDLGASDIYRGGFATAFSQAAWAVVTMTTDGDVEIGPFDIDTSLEEVILWCILEYSNVGGGGTEDVLELRLAYSDDNGSSWNTLANTVRRVGIGATGKNIHGSIGIARRITTSIDATQTMFRLEAQETNGNNFTLDDVLLFAIRRKL